MGCILPTHNNKDNLPKLTIPHTSHLTPHPDYPPKSPVKNSNWEVPDPDYNPVEFTSQKVLENDRSKKVGGWADPPDPTTTDMKTILATRRTNAIEGKPHLKLHLGPDGRPRNPFGRTGIRGRGTLGKWGTNPAVDPIVTRFNNGILEIVAIERKDHRNVWAIPGGMVDDDEQATQALIREFMEEAGAVEDEVKRKELLEFMDDLFANRGQTVYLGYVDDPRNTDNAWIETTAAHFHIDDETIAKHLTLKAGDDARNVQWMKVDDSVPEFKTFYASHRIMVAMAIIRKIKTTKSPKEKQLWKDALARVSIN
jgi:ADP-ribose pyrophosphatase